MSEFREHIDAICSVLPGAIWSDPAEGNLASWKVGDKMFACLASAATGVSVKTPDVETAAMLIDAGVAEKAPYFHKSWVRFYENANSEEVQFRVHASYDLIRSKLPAKVRNALPPREGT